MRHELTAARLSSKPWKFIPQRSNPRSVCVCVCVCIDDAREYQICKMVWVIGRSKRRWKYRARDGINRISEIERGGFWRGIDAYIVVLFLEFFSFLFEL